MIDILKVKQQVKLNLDDEKRYQHSLSVANKCVELIDLHLLDIDKDKAYLAGLVHDYAKNVSKEEYKRIINQKKLNIDIESIDDNLLHAFLGVIIIEDELFIDDPEILEAVYYHPIGYEEMEGLTELLFIADFIDDLRDFTACIEARRIAEVDYKRAIFYKLDYLINNLPSPHKQTIKAHQRYRKYKGGF